eukprot:15412509-Alexandrium_andersonii.AAC.1
MCIRDREKASAAAERPVAIGVPTTPTGPAPAAPTPTPAMPEVPASNDAASTPSAAESSRPSLVQPSETS